MQTVTTMNSDDGLTITLNALNQEIEMLRTTTTRPTQRKQKMFIESIHELVLVRYLYWLVHRTPKAYEYLASCATNPDFAVVGEAIYECHGRDFTGLDHHSGYSFVWTVLQVHALIRCGVDRFLMHWRLDSSRPSRVKNGIMGWWVG